MPKVIVSDKKGLNQVAGGGLEVKLGDLTWTRRMMTQEITLADNATASTFSDIVLPAGGRVVSYKIEIVKVGGENQAITKVGSVGDDDLLTADCGLTDQRALSSKAGFPLGTGAPAEGLTGNDASRVLEITHGDPGAAGPTVRATVIVETVA